MYHTHYTPQRLPQPYTHRASITTGNQRQGGNIYTGWAIVGGTVGAFLGMVFESEERHITDWQPLIRPVVGFFLGVLGGLLVAAMILSAKKAQNAQRQF